MEEEPPPPLPPAPYSAVTPEQQALQQEFKALRAALAAAIKALKDAPVPPLKKRGRKQEQGQEQEAFIDVPALGKAVLAALSPDTPEEQERWARAGARFHLILYVVARWDIKCSS
jgi:anti-sigma factor RsiW